MQTMNQKKLKYFCEIYETERNNSQNNKYLTITGKLW